MNNCEKRYTFFTPVDDVTYAVESWIKIEGGMGFLAKYRMTIRVKNCRKEAIMFGKIKLFNNDGSKQFGPKDGLGIYKISRGDHYHLINFTCSVEMPVAEVAAFFSIKSLIL